MQRRLADVLVPDGIGRKTRGRVGEGERGTTRCCEQGQSTAEEKHGGLLWPGGGTPPTLDPDHTEMCDGVRSFISLPIPGNGNSRSIGSVGVVACARGRFLSGALTRPQVGVQHASRLVRWADKPSTRLAVVGWADKCSMRFAVVGWAAKPGKRFATVGWADKPSASAKILPKHVERFSYTCAT